MYKLPSEKIRARIEAAGARYFANDNISEFLEEGDKDDLIDELMIKFGDILDTLLIDQDNDPNSMGTARRLAKMYINEIMGGRHPIETLHTIDEVLMWFNKNDIEYISSIPSCDFVINEYGNIFEKKKIGTSFSRIYNQILMMFNSLGSDGGLFIVIGKKK